MTTRAEITEKFNSWTKEHSEKARSQGWDLVDYKGRGLLQIEAVREMRKFHLNKDLEDYLHYKLEKGDELVAFAVELEGFFDPFINLGAKIEEDYQQTTKRKAVAVIEFDDAHSNFLSATDFATYIQGLLEQDFADCAVTVYSTPDDLNTDIQDGIGPYADWNTSESLALPADADEKTIAPKF